MSQLMWLVVAAVGVVAGVAAIQFTSVLVRLMQIAVQPLRVVPLDAAPELRPHEEAAVAELTALGFRDACWSELEVGSQRFKSVLLRHETEPAFAELTLGFGGVLSGYSVAFHTFRADGTRLVTRNRSSWLVPGSRDGVEATDAYANDVAGHWLAHRARLAEGVGHAIGIAEAQQILQTSNESQFQWLRDSGAITLHGDKRHYTFAAAWRMARVWFRERHRMARPYRSAASSGEHEGPFFAGFFLETEQAHERITSRHDVKLWVLGLSAVLSLVGWGLAAGWSQAVALVAIIFFHEGGHALAMRAFGYRHMHMFFIPFVGAVVTGAPKEMPAWRQAVVLLAGPVPGLLAAVALLIYLGTLPYPPVGFDWEKAAVMAVWINLFNLLPIMPLDGGQLMELALFRRWPRSRYLFVVASAMAFVALAFWIKGPYIWAVTFFVLWVMWGQWRLARLQQHWQEGLPIEEQLVRLFEFTRSRLKITGFATRYGLVKAAVGRQRIGRARAWEGAAVLLVMVALWSAVVMVVRDEPRAPGKTTAETRTPAQVAFDNLYWDYLDEEERSAVGLAAVEASAAALDAADPRRIDLEVERAALGDRGAYRARLEELARAGRDGHAQPVEIMVHTLLDDPIRESAADAPAVRAKRLRGEVDRMMALAPRAYDGTVDARLRIAEALDRAGDAAAARAALAELERTTKGSYWRAQVLDARAWFHLSHGEHAEAQALIRSKADAAELKDPTQSVSLTYAWALLLAGQIDEGVEQMRRATYPPWRPTLGQRLRGGGNRTLRPLEPVDLAYALRLAGRESEARRVIANESWHCWRTETEQADDPTVAPWQGIRHQLSLETLRAVCPARERSCKKAAEL